MGQQLRIRRRARPVLPCITVLRRTCLDGSCGCLTDVPGGKRALPDGLKGTENPRVGGSIPPLGTNNGSGSGLHFRTRESGELRLTCRSGVVDSSSEKRESLEQTCSDLQRTPLATRGAPSF